MHFVDINRMDLVCLCFMSGLWNRENLYQCYGIGAPSLALKAWLLSLINTGLQ